ncbi:DNA alkylation repair protein [Actinopolymorpha cephalotaxi]|uniref:3-methyladenine DNA glycosylase AlkD n=1 Tax=Actinopolymorpha cephalotaxi TaxID=504797 RepID=A0ABX2S3C7_9ACTN|nr:DNA alkylation repair protein [Actinopolymorpha cephalotaxi]NYH83548.1 3-methyladenine DNA glycosylase AlkD [Actinopolymorpha cephalotaxi]
MNPRSSRTRPPAPGRPEPDQRLVEAVRAALAAAGDPERAERMRAYMKSAMPFRGVPAPALKRLCREVLPAHPVGDRASWEATVRTLWDDAAFREERYAALALTGHRGYRRWQDAGTLRLYEHLAVTGAWWDHVDEIAANRVGPILAGDPAAVAPVLLGWAAGEDVWLRRVAILAQLKAKVSTDTDLLRACLEPSLGRPEFFLRKAIGWALREYARTDPTWVLSYVAEQEDRLAPLSRREALKHHPPP